MLHPAGEKTTSSGELKRPCSDQLQQAISLPCTGIQGQALKAFYFTFHALDKQATMAGPRRLLTESVDNSVGKRGKHRPVLFTTGLALNCSATDQKRPRSHSFSALVVASGSSSRSRSAISCNRATTRALIVPSGKLPNSSALPGSWPANRPSA